MGSGKGKTRRLQATTEAKGKKARSAVGSLIPKADSYIQNNMNVLLMGLHGTGKTVTMLELAKKHNLKLKYLSASTLDPYTDLVGIPVPEGDNIVFKRPRDIDEAELIVIDEFNRAHPKVMNTLFELIQFKSINGEKLPKLRMVWAAMNPPDGDYDVEEVDPALLDRFDAYVAINPKPSVKYMTQYMREGIAQALKTWWDQQDQKKRENYISPRRLVKLGILFEKTGEIRAGLPPWGNFDIKKLEHMLRHAARTPEDIEREQQQRQKDRASQKKNASKPISPTEIKGTAGWMKKNAERIRNHLQDDPNDPILGSEVTKGMKKIGAASMADYTPILDALNKKDLEAIFSGRNYSYKAKAVKAIQDAYPNLDDFKKEFPQAFKSLSDGFILFHPKDLRHWGP